MRISELRDKSSDELAEKVVELTKELFNLRFQKVAQQVQNTARVRQVRRTIAQIKTLQQEKVLDIIPRSRSVKASSVPSPKKGASVRKKGK